MKKFILSLSFCSILSVFGQIPAYYSSIDFTLTEAALKDQLSTLITSTHTNLTSYSEVWDVLKSSDLDPTNSGNVLLIYGYDDDDGDIINDRSRNKNYNGGSVGDWNREHVFPKSLGSPNLGTTGPGSDPHNLRASDVQMNGNRSNRKFATGSGDAGTAGSNWYPGNEWKGDAARIVMYMYLRYGNRCLPNAVTVGSTNALDPNMVDLLLEWNAEDDVSEFEKTRNNEIQDATGNRNPFIDNPYIATQIWGGIEATDTWGNLGISQEEVSYNIALYPNPVSTDVVYISNTSTAAITSITISNTLGQQVAHYPIINETVNTPINIEGLPSGLLLVNITTPSGVVVKKLLIQ